MFNRYSPRNFRGFSLVELLTVVSVMGLLAAIGFQVITKQKENLTRTKLEADVWQINRAIGIYLATGGKIADATLPDEVIRKLKTIRDDGRKYAGIQGSMIDKRLDFEICAKDDVQKSRSYAYWDDAGQRFKAKRGAQLPSDLRVIVENFTVNDKLAEVDFGSEKRFLNESLNEHDGWIWAYEDSNTTYGNSPSVVVTTAVASSGVAAASPLTSPAAPPHEIIGPSAIDDSWTSDEDVIFSTENVFANDIGSTLTLRSLSFDSTYADVSVSSSGNLTFIPVADFNGSYSFTYSMADRSGVVSSAVVSINIAPVNDTPIAVNDVGTTDQGVPVTVDVLSNDTDIDGDTLKVVSATGNFGTVVVEADGQLTYSPDIHFSGLETISYTIADNNGGTATSNLVIDVIPADADFMLDYDVISWSNVKPHAAINGMVLAGRKFDGDDAWSVGGDFTDSGDATLILADGATFSGGDSSLVAGGYFEDNSINIRDVKDEFTALSTALKNAPANSSYGGGVFNANPDADGVAVFNASIESVFSGRNLSLNANGAKQILVNLSGDQMEWDGGAMTGELLALASAGKVIWNFHSAKEINTKAQDIYGTFLAPKAAFHDDTGGTFHGQVFVKTMETHSEIHVNRFSGDVNLFVD